MGLGWGVGAEEAEGVEKAAQVHVWRASPGIGILHSGDDGAYSLPVVDSWGRRKGPHTGFAVCLSGAGCLPRVELFSAVHVLDSSDDPVAESSSFSTRISSRCFLRRSPLRNCYHENHKKMSGTYRNNKTRAARQTWI